MFAFTVAWMPGFKRKNTNQARLGYMKASAPIFAAQVLCLAGCLLKLHNPAEVLLIKCVGFTMCLSMFRLMVQLSLIVIVQRYLLFLHMQRKSDERIVSVGMLDLYAGLAVINSFLPMAGSLISFRVHLAITGFTELGFLFLIRVTLNSAVKKLCQILSSILTENGYDDLDRNVPGTARKILKTIGTLRRSLKFASIGATIMACIDIFLAFLPYLTRRLEYAYICIIFVTLLLFLISSLSNIVAKRRYRKRKVNVVVTGNTS